MRVSTSDEHSTTPKSLSKGGFRTPRKRRRPFSETVEGWVPHELSTLKLIVSIKRSPVISSDVQTKRAEYVIFLLTYASKV
jgi:hypothetical protein